MPFVAQDTANGMQSEPRLNRKLGKNLNCTDNKMRPGVLSITGLDHAMHPYYIAHLLLLAEEVAENLLVIVSIIRS